MQRKTLIILTILLVLIFSCAKEIKRFELTDEVKQVIPYEKGQIVSFMDKFGKIIDFLVIESKSHWYIEEENSFRADYYSFEVKEATLKSQTNNIEIKLLISNPICNPDDCSPNNKDLYISIVKNSNTQCISKQLLYNKEYGILQASLDGENLLTIDN